MKVYLFLFMLFFCQTKAEAQVWIQFKGTTTDKMVLGKIYPQAYIRERFGEPVSFNQEKSEEDEEDPYDFKNYDYDSFCFCTSDDQLKCFCTTSEQTEVYMDAWSRAICIGDKGKPVWKMAKEKGYYIAKIIDYFYLEIPDPENPSEKFVMKIFLDKKRKIVNIEARDPRTYRH